MRNKKIDEYVNKYWSARKLAKTLENSILIKYVHICSISSFHCFYVVNSGTSNIIGTLDFNAFPATIACLNFSLGKDFEISCPK